MDREEQARRDFILASAFFHIQSVRLANCSRVLRHAMIAAGVWDESFNDAFDGNHEKFPVASAWYATLIELTREEESMRLLDGGGNLTLPAGAHFTGCCLTRAGRTAAERLLANHPEWGKRLSARE
jgi:hypothetical protein